MYDDERDILISNVIDGEADEQTWLALDAMASTDASIWRDLAAAQRDHAAVTSLTGHAGAVAGGVQAPVEINRSRLTPAGRTRGWLGWAVAATVFLAWTATRWQGPAPPDSSTINQAGLGSVPVSTAQEAFDAYLEKGRAEDRVIQEMPRKVLLDSRAHPSGHGVEVVFLRQVMERTVVPNLYQFRGQDEGGRPVLARYRPTPRGAM